jgi:hypothetical protein
MFTRPPSQPISYIRQLMIIITATVRSTSRRIRFRPTQAKFLLNPISIEKARHTPVILSYGGKH